MTTDEFIVALSKHKGEFALRHSPSGFNRYRIRTLDTNCCPIERVAGTGPHTVGEAWPELGLDGLDTQLIILAADNQFDLPGRSNEIREFRTQMLKVLGLWHKPNSTLSLNRTGANST